MCQAQEKLIQLLFLSRLCKTTKSHGIPESYVENSAIMYFHISLHVARWTHQDSRVHIKTPLVLAKFHHGSCIVFVELSGLRRPVCATASSRAGLSSCRCVRRGWLRPHSGTTVHWLPAVQTLKSLLSRCGAHCRALLRSSVLLLGVWRGWLLLHCGGSLVHSGRMWFEEGGASGGRGISAVAL